jgi:hypothetical protein
MTSIRTHAQSILSDTRNIQKEINTCVEALNTAYGATDHMVYRDAQKGDSAAKKMYKELVGMHECFERLSKAIAESGEILSMVWPPTPRRGWTLTLPLAKQIARA